MLGAVGNADGYPLGLGERVGTGTSLGTRLSLTSVCGPAVPPLLGDADTVSVSEKAGLVVWFSLFKLGLKDWSIGCSLLGAADGLSCDELGFGLSDDTLEVGSREFVGLGEFVGLVVGLPGATEAGGTKPVTDGDAEGNPQNTRGEGGADGTKEGDILGLLTARIPAASNLKISASSLTKNSAKNTPVGNCSRLLPLSAMVSFESVWLSTSNNGEAGGH